MIAGWTRASLGDVCTVTAGGTPSRANPDYWDGDIPWVKISDMLQGVITHTDEKLSRLGLTNSAAKVLPKGTLLLSIFATIGRTAVLNLDATTNQAIVGLGIKDSLRLERDYLRRFLEFKTTDLQQQARGVAQVNINGAILKTLQIPLPPLSEQRRIADVMDQAEALRAKRRAALAKLDTLTQAIFLDMFGDPATNPRGWETHPVSDYVLAFQGGKSMEAEASERIGTRNRILKISAVTGMRYLPNESKPIPDTYEPPAEHFVRAGDLLFSRANTTELVGAVAYVEDTPSNLLLPDKLWRFVWNPKVPVDPRFVWCLFQTDKMRYEIGRRATGTSGSMKNISQEKVLGISSILPPLEIQRAFARSLKSAQALSLMQEASAREIDALFASLQHRAFRGEL